MSSKITLSSASFTTPISREQAIFISQLISNVPCKDGGSTGRRGFALQNATAEDVESLLGKQAQPVPFLSKAAASAILDFLKEGKVRGDAGPSIKVAAWLDGLVEAGRGQEASSAWLAQKAAKAPTVLPAGASALDRFMAAQRGAMTPAPAAPATPAITPETIAQIVAQAVAMALAAHKAEAATAAVQTTAEVLNSASKVATEEAAKASNTTTVIPAGKDGGKSATK